MLPGIEWDDLVSASPFGDTYFRPAYVAAHEHLDAGRAMAVLTGGCLVPVFVGPVTGLPFSHSVDGFDAVTPYGYGGMMPLSDQAIDCGEVYERLVLWARQENVICCFLRLHPLLPISEDLRHAAAGHHHEVRLRGLTTGVTLSDWDQRRDAISGMSDGRISDLSKARRHLEVEWADLEDPGRRAASLELFQQLYNASLDRLNAPAFYRFPDPYYRSLAEGLGNILGLAFATFEGKPAAASMFFFDRHFAHYHLSCSNELGRKYRGSTLLINAAAERARDRGCRLLHLGGGTRKGDPLWGFKESFGGRIFEHYTVNLVVDHKRYDALVAARKAAAGLPVPSNSYVFYRT